MEKKPGLAMLILEKGKGKKGDSKEDGEDRLEGMMSDFMKASDAKKKASILKTFIKACC